MKAILIEPNLIMNKGLSIFLNNLSDIDLVKSFTYFEQFLTNYSIVKCQNYDIFILNIAYINQKLARQYIEMVTDLLEKKIVIIIHNDKPKSINKSNSNEIRYIKINEDVEEFKSLIEAKIMKK